MAKTNKEEIQHIPLSELKLYEDAPFKVRFDDNMTELIDSIKDNGVLVPAVARPHIDGGYEILAGQRRLKASELAGYETMPVIVKDLDDDTAIILLVDSNIHREDILPSEKAKAYDMKLEAMKRKAGRPSKENSEQIALNYSGKQSSEILGEQVGESKDQIRRYIRLNNLIDPILQMVDEKKIAFNAAVELSYLGSKEQAQVMYSIEAEEEAPSIEQAKKIRRFSQDGKLSEAVIESIMQEQKPEKVKITIDNDRLNRFFPKNYTKKQIEEAVFKGLELWHRQRMRKRDEMSR